MKLLLPLLMCFTLSAGAAEQVEDELQKEKRLSQEYLDQVKKEPGTLVIEQGILIKPVYHAASGASPTVNDTVKVIYHGLDREGNVFDSAFDRDEAAEFPLNRLITCWKIAIPKITVGSLYKVTCPAATAYGDRGAGGVIKPGAAITFKIFLAEIISRESL